MSVSIIHIVQYIKFYTLTSNVTYISAIILQRSLLLDDLVGLDLVVDFKVLEAFKGYTTFRSLGHLHDVLLDMLERVDFA